MSTGEWYCKICHYASGPDFIYCSKCHRPKEQVECSMRELALRIGCTATDKEARTCRSTPRSADSGQDVDPIGTIVQQADFNWPLVLIIGIPWTLLLIWFLS